MPDPSDDIAEIKARLTALEVRAEQVAADARAVRYLVAAYDRDIAELSPRARPLPDRATRSCGR